MRENGSKLIDHAGTAQSVIKYFFKEKTVLIASDNVFADELPYSVKNFILNIGNFTTYKIDIVDSEILVVTQFLKKELTDDKINRYIFLNRHSIFEYLKETGEIKIIGDSLINVTGNSHKHITSI